MAEWLSVVRDAFVVLGGLVGIGVGAYQYRKWRHGEVALRLSIGVSPIRCGSGTLLDVAICVKNVGRVAAFVGPESQPKCMLWVRHFPRGVSESHVTWNMLNDRNLVEPIAFFSEWFEVGAGAYAPDAPLEFEPGTTEDFHVVIRTEMEGPLWLRAEVVDAEGYSWRADRVVLAGGDRGRETERVSGLEKCE